MKIAFFLTPKAEVAWLPQKATLRQAIEKMEHYGYTAVPILTSDGEYDSTLTEGDILWFFKEHPLVRFEDTEHVSIADVKRRLATRTVEIDADIEALFMLALDQNFVPVVDGRSAFIGIVRRRSILAFLQERAIAALRG